MDIKTLSKTIQKNFISLSSKLDIKEFLEKMYENNSICIYDFEHLLSKPRIERNFYFFSCI